MLYAKFRSLWSSLSTLLIALVPVFKSCPPCPVCMPKYTALFAFFGLELADYSHYLAPVMLISMTFTLGSMFRQVKERKLPVSPLYTAFTSCIALLICRYVTDNTSGVYLSMLGLLGSVLLHTRSANRHHCPKSSCCLESNQERCSIERNKTRIST